MEPEECFSYLHYTTKRPLVTLSFDLQQYRQIPQLIGSLCSLIELIPQDVKFSLEIREGIRQSWGGVERKERKRQKEDGGKGGEVVVLDQCTRAGGSGSAYNTLHYEW
jgi:hypothetical protein